MRILLFILSHCEVSSLSLCGITLSTQLHWSFSRGLYELKETSVLNWIVPLPPEKNSGLLTQVYASPHHPHTFYQPPYQTSIHYFFKSSLLSHSSRIFACTLFNPFLYTFFRRNHQKCSFCDSRSPVKTRWILQKKAYLAAFYWGPWWATTNSVFTLGIGASEHRTVQILLKKFFIKK